MRFNLPDLGEGLPDAEIKEWYVKEGDTVKVDQPIVSMETAKAVVDVPSPFTGKIAKLFGKAGDLINTGSPLVEFVSEQKTETTSVREDAGTVVGSLEMDHQTYTEKNVSASQASDVILATTSVRSFANQMHVNIREVQGSGKNGEITIDDIRKAAKASPSTPKTSAPSSAKAEAPNGFEGLRGVRRTMAIAMSKSHHEIVPVTIYDEARIYQWPKGTDITYRVIRAIADAVQTEPALNAWYDTASMSRKIHSSVNVGLALDSKEGLFVPVLKNVTALSPEKIRETINRFKTEVADRSIKQEEMHDMSIMYSNFGMFAGKYASPIIVPPCVAILGTGRIHEQVLAIDGIPTVGKVMPLSLTFDHRAVTGGEATRFLAAIIQSLENKSF